MDSKINIRLATNKDTENIKNLVFGVLAEYGLTPDTNGVDSDLNDIGANYIKRGGVFEILENETGEILGTVGLFPLDKETIELRKMYFAQEIRGRGIGKKTLERMIETARQLGYKTIHLETASVLKEAIGLYKKYGFEPTTEGLNAERCNKAFTLEIA